MKLDLQPDCGQQGDEAVERKQVDLAAQEIRNAKLRDAEMVRRLD